MKLKKIPSVRVSILSNLTLKMLKVVHIAEADSCGIHWDSWRRDSWTSIVALDKIRNAVGRDVSEHFRSEFYTYYVLICRHSISWHTAVE